MKKEFINILQRIREKYKTFKKTPFGKKVIRIFTNLLQGLIVGIIIYQLAGIGWANFLYSLPTQPAFYLLFLFIYFLLPFSEIFAYKIIWDINFFKSISPFIRKRIFNKDVMGYSGELVLMQWAINNLPASRKQIFKDIRDVNIISSTASTFIALGALGIFIFSGQIRAMDFIFSQSTGNYLIGGIILLLIGLTAYHFRKYIFSMSLKPASKIFAIHTSRMIILFVAQILQWHIVLPDISLDIWFTFLSVNIIISRIPFLPSQDLVATGTNIELAKLLRTPVAGIAGIFLVHNVLDKILNLAFYVYYSWTGQTASISLKENTAAYDTGKNSDI